MVLNDKQLKAIQLLVYTNMKQKEVAAEINVSEDTITRWKKDEEFRREYDNEFRESFKDLATEAKGTVATLMRNAESETVRLNASKDILSRSGYDASQKVEQVSETTIKVDISED
jgi:transposase